MICLEFPLLYILNCPVKHVKEGKSIGLSAKELGLVEQTLRNWVRLSAAGKLHLRGCQALSRAAAVITASSRVPAVQVLPRVGLD